MHLQIFTQFFDTSLLRSAAYVAALIPSFVLADESQTQSSKRSPNHSSTLSDDSNALKNGKSKVGDAAWPGKASSREEFVDWQEQTRQQLRKMLGIPSERVLLAAEKRGESEHDGIVIERWVFTCEPGSRATAVLYRPKSPSKPMPAMVFTFGHGGSKSHWSHNYAGQLYAKLGLAALAIDPLGEEERHSKGLLGTREHDQESVDRRAQEAGRLMMGKLVFDTMRGVDFLMERNDIDHQHIGVAGYSLGGAEATWMAALEPRIKLALVCGWAYQDLNPRAKACTRIPSQRLRERLTWTEFASLSAPQCAVVTMNGDADDIIDFRGDSKVWVGNNHVSNEVASLYTALHATATFDNWLETGGGHRPYFAYREALEFIHRSLGTPGWTLEQVREIPTLNAGRWCDKNGVQLEKLYGTSLHDRGATLPDLKLTPTPKQDLTCLKPVELGSPDFTFEGWLKAIENHAH